MTDTLTRRLQMLRDQLDTLAQDVERTTRTRDRHMDHYFARHADAISPNVPEGYDTILGYLARFHPDVLDMVNYSDPSVTMRDGYKLMHLVRRNNAPTIWVEAPACLHEAGIKIVRAYPEDLLAQRGW